MPECQSWRIGDAPHEELHKPGTCPVCWVECHNTVDDPQYPRCRSCYESLASSPLGWVRLLLINEEDPPDYVVAALVDDGNFAVAGTARWHLYHRSGMTPKMADGPDAGEHPVPIDQGLTTMAVASDSDDEFEVGTW